MAYFKAQIPDEVRSKSSGEKQQFEQLCFMDWMPLPVARFLYRCDDLRKWVESDFLDTDKWVSAPFMAQMIHYEKEAESWNSCGSTRMGLEAYVNYLRAQHDFTKAMKLFSGIMALNENEASFLPGDTDPQRKPFELKLIDEMKGQDTSIPDAEIRAWVRTIRLDTMLRDEYMHNDVAELRPEHRKSCIERGWHSTAGHISWKMKDEPAQLEDALNALNAYYWASAPAKLQWLDRAICLAGKLGDDKKLDEAVEAYKGRQRQVVGHYWGGFYGWRRRGLEYHDDEGHREIRQGSVEATPVLAALARGSGYCKLSDDVLQRIAAKLGPAVPLDEEDLARLKTNLESLWKGRPEEARRFDMVMRAAGYDPDKWKPDHMVVMRG